MLKKGYILIVIGGGVTGDIQVNDTHYHHQLKQHYRDLEIDLMLTKLTSEPNKVPSPSKDDMMAMLNASWKKTAESVNPTRALKEYFLLIALDGSKDYMLKESLMSMIGEDIIKFSQDLMLSPPP